MPQIEVKIDRNGTMNVEAIGFKGEACRNSTHALLQAMGIDPTRVAEEPKPEMYETDQIEDRLG